MYTPHFSALAIHVSRDQVWFDVLRGMDVGMVGNADCQKYGLAV
jgi:hypothetical protein